MRHSLATLLLRTCAAFLLLFVAPTQGGHCWSMIGKNNRCTELLRTQVSREECCSDGSATIAWSSEDLPSGELFFWRALGGGVPCEPCKDSCNGVECGEGKKCVIKNNKPKCVCAPECSKRKRLLGEVCGTDGRTYRHMCRLMKRKCRKDQQLAVAYYGPCQKTCDKIKCPGKKTCLLDQNLRPHCVRCKQTCPPLTAPRYVCGADNVTYNSICHLRQAACLKGRAVQAAYKGKCKAKATCTTIRCPRGRRCMTDPMTGRPRCITCPVQCLWPKTDTLCASNNRTYSSWCEMMRDACHKGMFLEPMSGGPCQEIPIQETNVIPLTLFPGDNLS